MLCEINLSEMLNDNDDDYDGSAQLLQFFEKMCIYHGSHLVKVM